MATWGSARPFGVALVLGLIVGGAGLAVHAIQADDDMPAAKRAAIAGAKTIDPSEINTRPRTTYVPKGPDEGVAEQVSQVRVALAELFGDYYSVGAMAEDLDVRHEQITGSAGRADRAAALSRVWDPATYEAELSILEEGFATFDGDTSSVGYSKAEFVATSWQKVSVKGSRAHVNVSGYIKYSDNDGSSHVDETKQWQFQLVRGGSPDNYRGWRILERTHAALPEGVDR